MSLICRVCWMGKKFHERQGQIVYWRKYVRYGENVSGRKMGAILRRHKQITMALSGFAPVEAVESDSSRES